MHTQLSSHEGRPAPPQLDALATLVSTKCRAAFSQLGEHEVAVDVDELDMACWTQLMQLVRDPDRIPATEGPSRAVVRLKTVEPTRKHLWDTTEKKEKRERDALAEHVRHAAHEASPRTPGPRLRPAARHPALDAPSSLSPPARAGALRRQAADRFARGQALRPGAALPARRRLVAGDRLARAVCARMGHAQKQARPAWAGGPPLHPPLQPRALEPCRRADPAPPYPCSSAPLPAPQVSSLVTASLDNYQHRGAAETAHVMLLAVAYDAARGACSLLPPCPHPRPCPPAPQPRIALHRRRPSASRPRRLPAVGSRPRAARRGRPRPRWRAQGLLRRGAGEAGPLPGGARGRHL